MSKTRGISLTPPTRRQANPSPKEKGWDEAINLIEKLKPEIDKVGLGSVSYTLRF